MRIGLIAATLGLLAMPAAAQEVFGLWQSEPSDRGADRGAYVHVRIGPCGSDASKACGQITDAFGGTSERRAEVVGRGIIDGMAPTAPNVWSGGTIWVPDMNVTSGRSSSRLTLQGQVLRVEGCVLGGVICRAQNWTRLE
ncbi:uncharacterized protein (DUF2147 family) [Hasllibacter halocynthiae]|uniref:Uncharacterized protein (DUF2147 family) n=1 Tax=Hasllibacter halocynthiae TaxID=595589 RepID=A0A2T0WZD6_9RHOB|nr:DUF2147 domain-containing protein [Hasllibacter halocynthiae]PRY92050.1 uncharacterized protein (DUF2147 family) [Hasllibacter halocynthiae]